VRKCLGRERDDEETDPVREGRNKASKHADITINKVDPQIKTMVKDLAKMIASETASVEERFQKADTNKDGNVSTKEFAKIVKGFQGIYAKMTEFEIDAIIECLDYNDNGQIEYKGFIKLGKQ
jgi:hypothetical protein